MAKRLGKADFETFIRQEKGLLLVDFYSDSCIPCKQLSPVLSEVEEEYEKSLKVCKVNINYDGEIAEGFQIMSVPALILLKDGEVLDKKTGFIKKDALKEWVSGYLD